MDNSSVIEEPKFSLDMKWNDEHEKILIDWADKAMCYRWLHSQANNNYSWLNAWFSIPVIIISTLTGTANFAQDRIDATYLSLFVMIVGSLNILAGIISTIQQFLKISDLKEAHRVSSIAWDKFYRNIKIELSKKPEERILVGQMLKLCKEEYDRLMETSPSISQGIIKKFNDTFKKTPNFSNLSKPEICDSLISTNEFVYKKEVINSSLAQPFVNRLKKERLNYKKKVTEFISSFKNTQGREPLKDEILDTLSEIVPRNILENLIDEVLTKNDDIKITVQNT